MKHVFGRNFGALLKAFLALVVALPVYFTLPTDLKRKYKTRLEFAENINVNDRVEYYDLNGDGNTERLLRSVNRNQSVSLVAYNRERVIEQWNFPGLFPRSYENLFIGDLNMNGMMEVCLFVLQDEALWLHIIDPLNSDGKVQSLFVDNIMPRDGLIEAWVNGGSFVDMNADGHTDFVFAVNATFSAYPRRVYILDGKTGELRRSKHLGVGIRNFHLFDLDSDGKPEIILRNSSYGNTKADTLQYDDRHCWLMVLNHELEFYFEPQKVGGIYHFFDISPHVADDTLLVGLKFSANAPFTNSQLLVFDKNGSQLRSQSFNNLDHGFSHLLIQHYKGRERPFLIDWPDPKIVLLDDHFDLRGKVGRGFMMEKAVRLDINGDGLLELVLMDTDLSSIRIYEKDFEHVTLIDFGQFLGDSPIFSVKKFEDANPILVVSGDHKAYHYAYFRNVWYQFRYPIYLIVYLLSFGFILLIQRMGQRQFKRRMAIEKELSTLQINNVLTQLDPHFTFNILNSVSAFIMREEKQKAYNQLRNFSRLIRSSLIDAEKVYRTIADELETIRNYLDLQAHNYPDQFDYEIVIGDKVDIDWSIPKMMLHTFADNALRHGIIPAAHRGKLVISVNTDNSFINISIRDNGIGREASAKLKVRSTRKGIALFRQFSEYYNRYNSKNIHLEITDLVNDLGDPAGTRVEIAVPIDYDFSGAG